VIEEYFDEIIEEDEVESTDNEQELYEHYRFVVDKGQSMIRIDKHLVNLMSGISRNRLQDAADAGNPLGLCRS